MRVLRCSKKLQTWILSLTLVMKALCKSLREFESWDISARSAGLDPSGSSTQAATLPKMLKLDPRCGVPKKYMLFVESVMWAYFSGSLLAVTSACSGQNLIKQRFGNIPV
jgi:hypothetical protein